MNNTEFNDIIDYAVEKENEAINFYSDLVLKSKLPFVIELLQDIINMEKGHINRLQQIRISGPDTKEVKFIEPLNLSDYLEEPSDFEVLDYPALLLIAMKREESAKKLYTDLASHISDLAMRNVFITLAEEEESHKIHFEKIYEENILKNN